jgi:hypothetical protein
MPSHKFAAMINQRVLKVSLQTSTVPNIISPQFIHKDVYSIILKLSTFCFRYKMSENILYIVNFTNGENTAYKPAMIILNIAILKEVWHD